jgi:tRNA-dihydrouridine synthase B
LRETRKSRLRTDHAGEPGPRVVQIAGTDPAQLADYARWNVDRGADIIDINMGCPAKKVCNVYAGSALLRDEALVARILAAVVGAVSAPVTLKIRTGWDPQQRNGVRIARIAEDCGVQSLAVHGRTRACGFGGRAEYETIRAIKQAVAIPVIANGDIDSGAAAAAVLRDTGADGIMIGRAAQGRPWIFREVAAVLRGALPLPPSRTEIGAALERHLLRLYEFYGEIAGVRIARKHVGWYLRQVPGGAVLRALVNRAEQPQQQLQLVGGFFATAPVPGIAA